jgi:hypothetical protein
LIEEKLSNIEKAGTQKALTGFIAREDIKTKEKHIKVIGFNRPELFFEYKMFAFYVIDNVAAEGVFPELSNQTLKRITI